MKLFNEYIPGHDWSTDQVEKAHRLGKPKEGGRARPILVKMVNPQDTFSILGNRAARNKMKEDNVHIAQDLTWDQQDILKQERDKGNLAYFVGGRLVVKEGEGKRNFRDSSRGRRRERGSGRASEDGSENSSQRGKRDRRGSAVTREKSNSESESRTRSRDRQRSTEGSPQGIRPWRFGFGSAYREYSTSRDRRNTREKEGAEEKDKDDTFKVPRGPVYRASTRPAHRNPYHYQSRSGSRQTRNSSTMRDRRSNSKTNASTSGQKSGSPSPTGSPVGSPTNSPPTSRGGSRQGSRHSSRPTSRGPSPQQNTSSDKEKDNDPEQQQMEEIGERLRQLSEDPPSKHKPVTSTHTFSNSKLNGNQGRTKSTQNSRLPGSKQDVQPAYKEKKDIPKDPESTREPETESDTDSNSPSTKQPRKRQKTTVRRFGPGAERDKLPKNDSNGTPTTSEGGFRDSRPRARVYTGRRLGRRITDTPSTTHNSRTWNAASSSHVGKPKNMQDSQPLLTEKRNRSS